VKPRTERVPMLKPPAEAAASRPRARERVRMLRPEDRSPVGESPQAPKRRSRAS
jgi:hypothetical protein